MFITPSFPREAAREPRFDKLVEVYFEWIARGADVFSGWGASGHATDAYAGEL